MMPLTVTYVRHGESEENVAWENGTHNMPEGAELRSKATWKRRLSALGIEQACAARRWITEWRRQELGSESLYGYVSPYARAMETAGHLMLPIRWRRETRIVECSWGECPHLTDAEIEKHFAFAFERQHTDVLLWRPVGGESMQQVLNRLHDLYRTLERDHASDHVICVAHGELILGARYIHEYWGPEDLEEVIVRPRSKRRLTNCKILQYSRIDAGGRENPHFVRRRFVDPTDPTNSEKNEDWQPVAAKEFSSEELLRFVEQHRRTMC